eukprot:gene15407-19671_t
MTLTGHVTGHLYHCPGKLYLHAPVHSTYIQTRFNVLQQGDICMITTWIQRKVRTALAAAVLGALGVSSAQAQDIRFGYNADQSGTAVAELGLAG